jgi:hypothetical protein
VVEELMATAPLNEAKWKVVHEESPDKRGIDVALAYNPARLKELHHEKIRFSFDQDPETTTRDILYVKLLSRKDTLHFFVNHWPSRRGGQGPSESKRLKAANMLLGKTDSILAIHGTYNYKGEWGMLDQFIVSNGLLSASKGYFTTPTTVAIVKEEWMLFKEEGKESAPSKTYGGPNYYGGYSDHLPIRMTISVK